MDHVHWLERTPGFDRSLRWLMVLTAIVVVMLVAGVAVLLVWLRLRFGAVTDAEVQDSLALVNGLLLLAACAGPLLVPIVLPLMRAMKAKIGADRERIHVLLHNGRSLVLLPNEIMHTQHSLLAGEHSFPLRKRTGESLYADGELENWISPLLLEANRLKPWQSLRHQWRYRDRQLLWPLASVAVLALLLVFATLLQQTYGTELLR